MITVKNLRKTFSTHQASNGFFASLSGLFSKSGPPFEAVNNISFTIHEGDFVGYLGPNGAGKSTTIKMLTGILVPSSGQAWVNGIEPYKNRQAHARQIGVVFGQRSQLWWDLPPKDAFDLLGRIYRVDKNKLRQRLDFFVHELQLAPFLNTPVRKLSLGQRMRCELTAAMLHEPKILFLDEPTIGLDIVAKESIRNFLKTINREKKTTILLTTHDLGDVEELCQRVIVIDQGKIIHDSDLLSLRRKFGHKRQLVFDAMSEKSIELPAFTKKIKQSGKRTWLEFDGDKIRIPEIITAIMNQTEILDFTVKEMEIEDAVKQIYG